MCVVKVRAFCVCCEGKGCLCVVRVRFVCVCCEGKGCLCVCYEG